MPILNSASDRKDKRLQLFCNESLLRQFDILCLQELFSTGTTRPQRLIDAFLNAHSIDTSRGAHGQASQHNSCEKCHARQANRHVHHLPSDWRALRPIDSGIWIISKHPIVEKDSITFSHGLAADAFTAKGVLAALVELPAQATDDATHEHGASYMGIFCTHLQADYSDKVTNREHRNLYVLTQLSQLREMKQFVARKMSQWRDRYGIQLQNACFLAGDVNVNARAGLEDASDSALYREMLDILNGELEDEQLIPSSSNLKLRFVDLLRERHYGQHPVTFGATRYDEASKEHVALETLLTHGSSQIERTRLDYIFQIECSNTASIPHFDGATENSPLETNSMSPDCSAHEVKVEPFFISEEEQEDGLTQLSDHYGISAHVRFHRPRHVEHEQRLNIQQTAHGHSICMWHIPRPDELHIGSHRRYRSWTMLSVAAGVIVLLVLVGSVSVVLGKHLL